MPEWNKSWNDYTDMLFLFLVKYDKILGTFFSVGDFMISPTNDVLSKENVLKMKNDDGHINIGIKGNKILWLNAKDNLNEYDMKNDTFPKGEGDQLRILDKVYLFHRNGEKIKGVYETADLTFYRDNDMIFVEKIVIQDITSGPEPITPEPEPGKPAPGPAPGSGKPEPTPKKPITSKIKVDSRDPRYGTDSLITKITQASNKLTSNLNELKSIRGGGKRFGLRDDNNKTFDEEQFKIMEDVVNNFVEFVDAFITYPTVLKLNSLSVTQVNDLFTQKINISINNSSFESEDSTEIKKIIFTFLFYPLKIDYKHANPSMQREVSLVFNEKINEYEKQIGKNIITTMGIYEQNNNIDLDLDDYRNDDRNTKIIHIKYLATIFKNIVLKLKDDIRRTEKSNTDIVNDVFYIIVDHIEKINDAFKAPYELTSGSSSEKKSTELLNIIKSLEKNNESFMIEFNKYLTENVSDKILTYVKINNFEHGKGNGGRSDWNKRFNILLNSITNLQPRHNAMVVKYNDSDFEYNNSDSEYNNSGYTKTYLFGKFSQIFPPNMNNSAIGAEMTQIVEKVKSGKPVFIMGYGASGSGKTSSLIYFSGGEQGQKEGIIVDICKKICQGANAFAKIVLKTEEIFKNNESRDAAYQNCEPEGQITNCKSIEYTFNFHDNDFEKEEKISVIVNGRVEFIDTNTRIHHEYRKPGKIRNSFGEILKYLIDSDRLVKATTNNPQSSRSHSFAFIKFMKEDENRYGYLIVGDFAGVENEFSCNNIVTIRDFLNLKKGEYGQLFYGGNLPDDINTIIATYIKNYTLVFKEPVNKEELTRINDSLGLYNNDRIFSSDFEFESDLTKIIIKLNILNRIPNIKENFLINNKKNILDFCDKYIEYADTVDRKKYTDNRKRTTRMTDMAEDFKKKVEDVYLKIEAKRQSKSAQEKQIADTKAERQRLAEAKAERQRLAEAKAADDAQRLAEAKTAEDAQRQADAKRIADEAKAAAEAERQRQADEAQSKAAAEAERQRQADQEQSKAAAEAAEAAEAKRLLDEALKKQKEKKALERKKNKSQTEKDRLAQLEKVLDDESAKKVRQAQLDKKRADIRLQQLKNQQEKIKQKEKEELAAKTIAEEKENYRKKLLDLSNKEINEQYIRNQINAIYEKYGAELKEQMNSQDDEEALKPILYKWIHTIFFNVDWLKGNDLIIDMEKFKNTRYDDMIRILSASIKKNKTIDTYENAMNKIEGLDKNYAKFNHIKQKPFKRERNNIEWQNLIEPYKNERFSYDVNNIISVYNLEDYNKFKKNIDPMIKTEDYNKELNGILNNHPFTNAYIQNNNTDLKNKTAISIFNIENAILEDIVTVLKNFKNRLTHGQEICKHRLYEGEFINNSLKEMREDIKNIFYEKQKDNIFISPDYVNLCLEKYCPTHSDCFNQDIQPNGQLIKSVIFNKIFNYLKTNQYFSKEQTQELQTTKFYQDILVSVFCVFNISPDANNPPPVPYIDINELKIALKKIEKQDMDAKNELIQNLKKIYYKIKGNSFDNTVYENENENTFDQSKTSSIQQFIFNNKNIFDTVFSILTKIQQPGQDPIKQDIFYIKKFIESIDNNNAISAIGTLEFLDQISKYHTTQTICFLEEEQIGEPDYKEIYNGEGTFFIVNP